VAARRSDQHAADHRLGQQDEQCIEADADVCRSRTRRDGRSGEGECSGHCHPRRLVGGGAAAGPPTVARADALPEDVLRSCGGVGLEPDGEREAVGGAEDGAGGLHIVVGAVEAKGVGADLAGGGPGGVLGVDAGAVSEGSVGRTGHPESIGRSQVAGRLGVLRGHSKSRPRAAVL